MTRHSIRQSTVSMIHVKASTGGVLPAKLYKDWKDQVFDTLPKCFALYCQPSVRRSASRHTPPLRIRKDLGLSLPQTSLNAAPPTLTLSSLPKHAVPCFSASTNRGTLNALKSPAERSLSRSLANSLVA